MSVYAGRRPYEEEEAAAAVPVHASILADP